MAQYELKLDKEACQSNFVCTAVDPKHFEEADDGKAGLVEASTEGKMESVEIDESDKDLAEQAANGCPMLAIKLVEAESGEVVAP